MLCPQVAQLVAHQSSKLTVMGSNPIRWAEWMRLELINNTWSNTPMTSVSELWVFVSYILLLFVTFRYGSTNNAVTFTIWSTVSHTILFTKALPAGILRPAIGLDNTNFRFVFEGISWNQACWTWCFIDLIVRLCCGCGNKYVGDLQILVWQHAFCLLGWKFYFITIILMGLRG